MIKTKNKIIYLSIFLVLAVFLVSACNEAVGKKIAIDGGIEKTNGYNQTNKTTGNLYASSSPSNANLYVDNIFKGLTPRLVNLSTGSHIIKFTKTGYYDYQDVKTIYANQITYINATLMLKNNQTNKTVY